MLIELVVNICRNFQCRDVENPVTIRSYHLKAIYSKLDRAAHRILKSKLRKI